MYLCVCVDRERVIHLTFIGNIKRTIAHAPLPNGEWSIIAAR